MSRRPAPTRAQQGAAQRTRGAIAVLTALLLPVMIGIAAYAIDTSLLLYRQERLLVATDIGAMAGAQMLAQGASDTRAAAMAEALVIANAGVTVTRPAPDQLVVAASLAVPRVFSQIFGSGDVIVRADARAVFPVAATPAPCIHLDAPSAQPALTIGNGARARVSGCGVVVASGANPSIAIAGGGRLETGCLTTAGRIDGPAAPNTCAAAQEAAATIPAPPALPDPTVDDAEPCAPTPGGDSARLQPGRYCDGLSVPRNGRTTGAPGRYVVEGDLVLDRGAALTLDPGSVIVLRGDARIAMDARATLTLVAPDSGPLRGVAILGTEAGSAAAPRHALGALDVTGLIALPGADLAILASTVATRCTRILAGRLDIPNGGTRFDTACAAAEGSGSVRLAPDP